MPHKDKARPKRRALGDITNSRRGLSDGNNAARKQQPVRKSIITTAPFKIPTDANGEIEQPEIVPSSPPAKPFMPVLFDEGELTPEERVDDGLDELGRPFVALSDMPREEGAPPFDTSLEDVYDGGKDVSLAPFGRYYSREDMFLGEEMPTLELA